MRILAVDFGSKRVGLALSDPTGTVAQGLESLPGGALAKVAAAVAAVAAARGADRIVVGLPWRLDGRSSPQTERTEDFIAALQRATSAAVTPWDERLTTAQADRVLLEGNVRRADRRGVRDKLAAQLLLQSYLDAQAPNEG